MSDIERIVAGLTVAQREAMAYVTGGNVYGARQRTYRYTDKAIRACNALTGGEEAG